MRMKYDLPKEEGTSMWMYSNEKEKGKETPKEFQKKEDIWIYSTERKKEIIFASQRHF